MEESQLAVQLWTLRQEITADLVGTMQQVARIGYAGVELWFQMYPPAHDLKRVVEDCQLSVTSAHVPFTELRDNFEAVAEYHTFLGNNDLVIPSIGKDLRSTEVDWKHRVREIADIAEKCRETGFRLSYHNHGFEFEDMISGMEAHDYIFSHIGPELLSAELDTCFLENMGKNPAEYVRRYSGRVPLLHLKELSKTPEKTLNTEIGGGVIDWGAVLKAAAEAEVEWYIVEQNCQGLPPLESIRVSLEYLRTHIT